MPSTTTFAFIIVVEAESNACEEEERQEHDDRTAQPDCPAQGLQHSLPGACKAPWLAVDIDDCGQRSVISTITNNPHSHAGLREGNIFTWQHQKKNDVPKGEIRTD